MRIFSVIMVCLLFNFVIYNHDLIYFNLLDPTITVNSPISLAMARALRSVKTFKKSWDSDKALKSTYSGKFGKHQIRAYIVLAFGYAIIASWLTEMPEFACKYFSTNFPLKFCMKYLFSIKTKIFRLYTNLFKYFEYKCN